MRRIRKFRQCGTLFAFAHFPQSKNAGKYLGQLTRESTWILHRRGRRPPRGCSPEYIQVSASWRLSQENIKQGLLQFCFNIRQKPCTRKHKPVSKILKFFASTSNVALILSRSMTKFLKSFRRKKVKFFFSGQNVYTKSNDIFVKETQIQKKHFSRRYFSQKCCILQKDLQQRKSPM